MCVVVCGVNGIIMPAVVLTQKQWQEQLERCVAEIGLKGIRMHGVLDDDMSVTPDRRTYHFYNVDRVFDAALDWVETEKHDEFGACASVGETATGGSYLSNKSAIAGAEDIETLTKKSKNRRRR